MGENAGREELRAEIAREHFARAALLGASLGLPEQELRSLRIKALWQMAAVNRNGPGTRSLAREYGFSKKELEEVLRQYADQARGEGDTKALEPCYDYRTGKYLAFEEWLEHLMRRWDRVRPS